MSSNYRTDIFLKKLYYIHEQCASARKKKEEEDAEKNMDDFTRLRKKIASDIREAKEVRFYSLSLFPSSRSTILATCCAEPDPLRHKKPQTIEIHIFEAQIFSISPLLPPLDTSPIDSLSFNPFVDPLLLDLRHLTPLQPHNSHFLPYQVKTLANTPLVHFPIIFICDCWHEHRPIIQSGVSCTLSSLTLALKPHLKCAVSFFDAISRYPVILPTFIQRTLVILR